MSIYLKILTNRLFLGLLMPARQAFNLLLVRGLVYVIFLMEMYPLPYILCYTVLYDFVFYKKHQVTIGGWGKKMSDYTYSTLRERRQLKNRAAEWFHSKWGVLQEAYLECMEAYLNNKTEYGWYLCLDGDRIIGGLGVIENDFHDRKDFTPNICAVYTEDEYRCKGIAGRLLDMAVEDLKSKGITPVYLVTDHTSFYERYGWEFLCMVQGDDELDKTRMYIHK